MSNSIRPTLLTDTLNLIQLARETARVQGKATQAERLAPVVDDFKKAVETSRDVTAASSMPAGMMEQSSFQTLLNVAQSGSEDENGIETISSPQEKANMVSAMSSGGMSELDIARQLGMTRQEVKLIMSVNSKRNQIQWV